MFGVWWADSFRFEFESQFLDTSFKACFGVFFDKLEFEQGWNLNDCWNKSFFGVLLGSILVMIR